MNVVGLRTRTGTPATAPSVARARSARRNGGSCQCAATASASRKPALWRVAAYSGPGLPRPTTARRLLFLLALRLLLCLRGLALFFGGGRCTFDRFAFLALADLADQLGLGDLGRGFG